MRVAAVPEPRAHHAVLRPRAARHTRQSCGEGREAFGVGVALFFFVCWPMKVIYGVNKHTLNILPVHKLHANEKQNNQEK